MTPKNETKLTNQLKMSPNKLTNPNLRIWIRIKFEYFFPISSTGSPKVPLTTWKRRMIKFWQNASQLGCKESCQHKYRKLKIFNAVCSNDPQNHKHSKFVCRGRHEIILKCASFVMLSLLSAYWPFLECSFAYISRMRKSNVPNV